MMKRLTLLPLLFSSGVLLFAQNAILPVTSLHKEYALATLLPKMAHTVNTLLDQPVQLSTNLPAGFLDEWCPLEITNCPGRPTKYLLIVTLDGFRWQEMFNGADSILLEKTIKKTGNEQLAKDYWANTPTQRRQLLLPFIWNTFVHHGQIIGNREENSQVNVANKFCISYPGYSEIFTGYADDGHICTNFKIKNRNTNVLDFINTCKGFRGRVASFASWDVFPSIFNENSNRFYVNAAFEPVQNDRFAAINQSLKKVSHHWGDRVRPDSLTFQYALQYLTSELPRVMHIGFGETDEYAHDNEYDHYLQAAHATDKMLEQLWHFIQTNPLYRNKTTLVITTDHSRGNRPDTWHKHHGLVEGSREIWLAIAGPGISAGGEMKNTPPLQQQQLARTFSALLGLDFQCDHPIAKEISMH